jgi:hypothetical protein
MGIANGSGHARTPRTLVVALVATLSGNAVALAVHEAPSDVPLGMQVAGSHTAPSVPPPLPSSTTVPPARTPPTTASRKGGAAVPETTTTTAAFASQIPLKAEGYQYELILEPKCTKVGEQFTATMRLKPKSMSSGTFMPIYADGSYEKGAGAFAKEDGTATYTWTAKDAPGEGRLLTQARDDETDSYGTKIIAFRVAGAADSC